MRPVDPPCVSSSATQSHRRQPSRPASWALGSDPECALVQDPAEAWRILVTDAAAFRQGKWKRRARRFLGPTSTRSTAPSTASGDSSSSPRSTGDASPTRHTAHERTLHAQELAPRRSDPVRERSIHCRSRWQATYCWDDLEPQAIETAEHSRTVMTRMPRLAPALPGTAQARALRRVHEIARAPSVAPPTGRRTAQPARDPASERAAPRRSASARSAFWRRSTSRRTALPPLYFLALDPEAEQRLHAELDAAPDRDERTRAPVSRRRDRRALRYCRRPHIDRCPAADTTVCGAGVRAGRTCCSAHSSSSSRERSMTTRARSTPTVGSRSARGHPRGAYLPSSRSPHLHRRAWRD
jgi:hypothetical protein